MTCFVRSRTWISNPFGDRKPPVENPYSSVSNVSLDAMEKLGLDPKELSCKFHAQGHGISLTQCSLA